MSRTQNPGTIANQNSASTLTVGQRVTGRHEIGTVVEIRKSGWCLVSWDSGETLRETATSLKRVPAFTPEQRAAQANRGIWLTDRS